MKKKICMPGANMALKKKINVGQESGRVSG